MPRFRLQPPGWKQILIALGAAVFVVVAATIAYNITHTPTQHIGGPAKLPPPVVQQPAVPQLQDVEAAFGRFDLAAKPDTSKWPTPYAIGHQPVLLVKNDGSVRQSQSWTVPLDSAWAVNQMQDVPQITNLSAPDHDYVTFQTSTGGINVYTVMVRQPFILEQSPEAVYWIASNGDIWATSLQSAKFNRHKL